MEIKVIDNLDEARRVWNSLSYNRTIFHSWDFRRAFYEPFAFPIFFVVGLENGEPVGLLPLQRNTEKKLLEFFGGDYMEDNCAFMKEGFHDRRVDLYNALIEDYDLECVDESEPEKLGMEFCVNKYSIKLAEFGSLQNFLESRWSGRGRKKLNSAVGKIEDFPPKADPPMAEGFRIEEGSLGDIELLFSMNKEMFGSESSFYCAGREDAFRKVAEIFKSDAEIMVFSSDGEKKAVSLAVKYNGVYEYMNVGVDRGVPNLGLYITYKNVQRAFDLGMKTFDAFTQNCGWKEKWHLDATPQYKKIFHANSNS